MGLKSHLQQFLSWIHIWMDATVNTHPLDGFPWQQLCTRSGWRMERCCWRPKHLWSHKLVLPQLHHLPAPPPVNRRTREHKYVKIHIWLLLYCQRFIFFVFRRRKRNTEPLWCNGHLGTSPEAFPGRATRPLKSWCLPYLLHSTWSY